MTAKVSGADCDNTQLIWVVNGTTIARDKTIATSHDIKLQLNLTA